MKRIKGIKSVVSEFNNICRNNFARIFFDAEKNEVYMIEYTDSASGPFSLPRHIHQIAHIARFHGKITMAFIHDCLNSL